VSPSSVTLGRYQLLTRIGSGSFAEVFRARDLTLNRHVALKALFPNVAATAEDQQRFLSEARALAALRHHGIVTIFDVGEAEGRPFFTMELLAGETLATFIAREGAQPLDHVLAIVRELADALDYLHAAGLVHRDVKDSNVMLALDGRVTLLDFGIALTSSAQRLTRAGVGLGTPETAAPEQILGAGISPAVDLYALGVLTYQMLCGRLPFTGDLSHVLYAQAHLTPPPLRDLRRDLPEWVYSAIAAMLAKEPAQRPRSAGEAVRWLAGQPPLPVLIPGRQPHRATATAPPTVRQGAMPGSATGADAGRRRRRAMIAMIMGVAATAMVATVAALLAAWQTDRPGQWQTATAVGVAIDTPPAAAVKPPPPRTVWTAPVAVSGSRSPFDIAVGPDGALWFTETGDGRNATGGIGRIALDGTLSERPAPNFSPRGITLGPDNALWYVSGSSALVVRLTPDGNQTTFYDWPGRSRADRVTAGPDGFLWFTEPATHTIARITLDGTVTQFSLSSGRGDPTDIVAGRDGALWFTELEGRIGRLTPAGELNEFSVPAGDGQPQGLTVGPDGAIWFTEASAGRIGRITPEGTVTEFPLPDPSTAPQYIVSGPDGALWFSEGRKNAIGRITLGGAVREFSLPTAGSIPQRIVVGPDAAFWFTEQGADRIGRLTTDGRLTEYSLAGQPTPTPITGH